MNNIEKHNTEWLINKELKLLFPNFRVKENGTFISEKNDIIVDFGIQVVTLAGQKTLRSIVNIFHKTIENKWLEFIDELMLQKNVLYSTIYISPRILGIANNLVGDGVVIDNMNNDELKEFIKELFGKIYNEKIDYYKSLENCDKTLNKTIEITDENRKLTSINGFPFRKVLLAEAVGNPNLPKIKEAMRKYCDEQYKIGKKENFEKLCRLKLVFEKMFG